MDPLPLRMRQPAPRFQALTEDGRAITLDDFRARQQGLLIFLLHGPECPHCAAIAAEMESRRGDWERWGVTALVVTPGGPPHAGTSVAQAVDPRALSRYGVPDGEIAVAALEQRGQVMDGWHLRHPAPLDWHEIAETARWIAIQEPECSTCGFAPGWEP